ncbi:MAG: MoaD/ThiS family protein [Chloroflexi bacterium]|nr:MoaD/ThiS family protein [Chloroflexota bacterium]
MVTIRVAFGTGFSRLIGTDGETLQLEKPTLACLAQTLTDGHGEAFRSASGGTRMTDVIRGAAVLVNGIGAAPDVVLKEGDEVAIFLMAEGG